jgi:hypothetical protein
MKYTSWFSFMALFLAAVLPSHAEDPFTPADLATPPAGVERIDLFLLIGQSNMKGRGIVPEQQTPNPRIVMMMAKNDQWYVARHPLHFAGDPVTMEGGDNAGVGPGLAFAEALAAKEPHTMIALIPCAKGGTKLRQWSKGAALYANAVRRARLALGLKTSVPVALKGALWLQGEADATPEFQPTYQDRLTRMIDDLRAELKLPDLPFIAATIGEFKQPEPGIFNRRAMINDALLALPKVRPNTACVNARDLTGNIGDFVHYDAASQNQIGARMAERYEEIKAGPR